MINIPEIESMIYNITKFDELKKTKLNKEKLKFYIRTMCPYQIVFNEDSITFKNRDYEPYYGIMNKNDLPSIDVLQDNLFLYKSGDTKITSYFYLYNDGYQPYNSKVLLKKYLKQLEFLKQYLD